MCVCTVATEEVVGEGTCAMAKATKYEMRRYGRWLFIGVTMMDFFLHSEKLYCLKKKGPHKRRRVEERWVLANS